MNSRINASLRNQNGFAWVAGLMLVGAIALTGVFAQTASAVAAPKLDICHKTGPTWQYMQTPAGPSFDGHVSHGDFVYTGPNEGTDEVKSQWCASNAETEAPICTPNDDLIIVSDSETMVVGDPGAPAVLVTPHSAWDDYDTLPAGASWIWNTEKDPANDSGSHPAGTVTFTRNFEIVGSPTGAVLEITADNEYTVSINGNPIDSDNDWQSVESYLIDASDLETGENVLTIIAVNAAGAAPNPAGLIFRLEVDSEICPDPTDMVTIHTQKIVCDEENDLPNWGAGTSTLNGVTSNTASRWLNANQGNGCSLAEWEFQWVDNALDSTNPGDQTEIAPSPWSDPFMDSVTFDAINMNRVWLREVFDADYIPFTGANTTENVSAEMYCGPDILNYDNWEFIDKQQDGWADDYYCVAFNVPLKRPEPNFCEGNLLTNGGFEENEVSNPALWELFASIPGWMVDWMNPSQDTPKFELQENGVVTNWVAFEGDQYLELDSDRPDTQANTKVWQNITTDDDKTYELSYQFSARPGTGSADNTVEVYWDGVWQQTITDDGTGDLVNVWLPQTISGLSATTTSTSLEFRATGTSNELGGFIDAVCLVEVEPEACTLEVISDTNNIALEASDNAAATWDGHTAWTANIPGATWIWETEFVQNPTTDETKTFIRHFWWSGDAGDAASLTIATDNSSEVWLNGSSVVVLPLENNFGLETTYDVSSAIVPGVNEIVVEVKNWALADSDAYSNPAGALYKLSVIGSGDECTPKELPECSDDIDNDEDGKIDFIGGDLGCEDALDDDETDEGPDYGPYCGNGKVDQEWEQCDPSLEYTREEGSCNDYCQYSNQCSDLVVARIVTEGVNNYDPDNVSGNNSEDMTEDLFIGGGVEGTHNIPGGTWFPVVLGDGTVVTDGAIYNSYEDVAGYAVDRDNGVVRVRMHGSHNVPGYVQPTEHVDGMIEIVHAYTNTSVLTDMESQALQNKLENPFNGTTGGSGNDELSLGGLGDFWMTVSKADDGFRAEYEVSEDLACEQCVDEDHGWSDNLEGTVQGTKKDNSAITNPDRTDPNEALGEADWVPNTGTNFYSLGKNGWITVSFDKFVPDVEGDDLSIHEGTNGQYPEEKASIEVSQDGSTWFLLTEEASNLNPGNVSYLDFSETGLAWIKYVRITDTTNYALHTNDADGFDLDAIDATWELCEEPKGDNEGSITIDKVVVGEGANGDLPFDFDLSWLDQGVDASISGNDTPETFSGLAAGSYTVTELISGEDDWYVTDVTCDTYFSHDTGEGDFEVTVGEGQDVICTVTNTYRPESNGDDDGTVTGYKWNDLNNDGEWNDGEPGLAGWTIELKGEGEPLASDVTDGDGFYSITFSEGPYTLCEVQQGGWTQTYPVGNGGCHEVDVVAVPGSDIGYNFGNHQNPQVNDDEPNNNTSRSNSRRSGGSSDGRVLGATTDGFCPFLKDYLHINMQNDPTEVNKAKAFFNSYLGKALILDGVFDQSLFTAAVEFQNMFSGDVLDTWVEEFTFLDDRATGYIYQTTKWKINSILCPGYEAFPDQLIVANGTTVAY